MAKVISVIGLGQIGTGALFALGRYGEQLTIQGYDPDPSIRQRAITTGALSEEFSDLRTLIQSADVVLDCSPYIAIKKNLHLIAESLPETAIYCCCAPNKRVLGKTFLDGGGKNGKFFGLVVSTNRDKWKLLSAKRVLNDAELFAGGSIGIASASSAEEMDIKRALDLVQLLGAKGILMDQEEADLIENRILINPILAAFTGVSAAIIEPGWVENELFTGHFFARGLDVTGVETAADLAAILTDAPDGALRWMTSRARVDKKIESAIRVGDQSGLSELLSIGDAEREEYGKFFDREPEARVERPRSIFGRLMNRVTKEHG